VGRAESRRPHLGGLGAHPKLDCEGSAIPTTNSTSVIALFADIKGYTELTEDLDPEDARRVVDPALQPLMEALHRYGGYVAQLTGDGIFALFGAPVAHGGSIASISTLACQIRIGMAP
jgi:class 3 adenylate cyclase